MRPTIIVMSHGQFGYELIQSAKMIIGEIEDIFSISMTDQDGLEGTNQKLTQLLAQFESERDIVILTDLKGGTPCNVAVMKMNQYPHLKVVSGMNLSMLIEASLSEITQSDELAHYLESIGKEAVERIVPFVMESDEDEYEE